MEAKKPAYVFKAGDRVKLGYSEWRGRIVEERGALGPGGQLVFRVRVPQKPKPFYIKVLEDQLILIPAPPKAEPTTLPATTNNEPQSPKSRPGRDRAGR